MDFNEALKEEADRRHPVRAEVAKHGDRIKAALANGSSLAAIWRTLEKEGLNVGKGESSFRNAVNHLNDRGWPDETRPSMPVDPMPAPVTSVAVVPKPRTRDGFADDRHDVDFKGGL